MFDVLLILLPRQLSNRQSFLRGVFREAARSLRKIPIFRHWKVSSGLGLVSRNARLPFLQVRTRGLHEPLHRQYRTYPLQNFDLLVHRLWRSFPSHVPDAFFAPSLGEFDWIPNPEASNQQAHLSRLRASLPACFSARLRLLPHVFGLESISPTRLFLAGVFSHAPPACPPHGICAPTHV